MFKSKMIENEKVLQYALNHQLPIVQVLLNSSIPKEQRLLCTECLDNADFEGKVIGFKKIIQMIEEQQNQKMNLMESMIIQNIKQVESFHSLISQMKSNIILQLEQLSSILKDWITNLQSIGLKYSQYSFHEELEIQSKKQQYQIQSNFIHQRHQNRIQQLFQGCIQIGVIQLILRIQQMQTNTIRSLNRYIKIRIS
ncbi:unnamed protein product [Paramecium sonneborni]|uniref:Uncharacterized protein n=1 Tax=Paramecium sonneborni TaxID=65129 RepID=A0A8S1RY02_9CILI|nr:unnamed protein product [Paramecium sonneborni]